MKIGYRTPSLKKSIKARTTGKIKRQVKSAVNPLYGKKGMGLINNPKKAVYNKIYNKTTIDPLKGIKTTSKASKKSSTNYSPEPKTVHLPKVTKTKIYSCNKWLYIFLAIFFGFFGAQYFYSGQKSKGMTSLLFCWTGIPFVIGLVQGFAAIFKKADKNGNISFATTEKVKNKEAIKDGEDIQLLLVEIEELEPTLKTTLDLEKYISTVQRIAENLNEVTIFSRTYANNPSFNAQSMASALEQMVQGLDEEEENFINRYYSEYHNDGKEKILEFKDYFTPNGVEFIEELYQ